MRWPLVLVVSTLMLCGSLWTATLSAAEVPVEVDPSPFFLLASESAPPACSASPAGVLAPEAEPQRAEDWDPATCAACGEHCSSSNLCFGLKIGDFCNNNGGICRAFDGCALFNCCRCSNAG